MKEAKLIQAISLFQTVYLAIPFMDRWGSSWQLLVRDDKPVSQ
jgi:hypothetical protein